MQPVFPVAICDGRTPVISQEFKAGVHPGVDIMFPRLPTDPPYSPNDPRGTKGFYVPLGALAVAPLPGYVLYAHLAPNGLRVRLAFCAPQWPLETLSLHLADLRVTSGQLVTAGQPLGLLGGDPTDADPHHTVHLHFERREDGRPVDPAPWLAAARYV